MSTKLLTDIYICSQGREFMTGVAQCHWQSLVLTQPPQEMGRPIFLTACFSLFQLPKTADGHQSKDCKQHQDPIH